MIKQSADQVMHLIKSLERRLTETKAAGMRKKIKDMGAIMSGLETGLQANH